ncbi:MAG: ribosomal-processing cysteine protease Prp [Clostridiales bacterium]|nr:ribosomal-processing cysteine protease Prp [Clostridiales bacterium]
MITCTFLQSGDALAGFECKGHAGYARAGRDIVCAGASILTIACANALESVAHVKPECMMEDGNLSVFLPREHRSHDTQVILMTLRQGMRDLQETYPKFVSLTEKTIMEE